MATPDEYKPRISALRLEWLELEASSLQGVKEILAKLRILKKLIHIKREINMEMKRDMLLTSYDSVKSTVEDLILQIEKGKVTTELTIEDRKRKDRLPPPLPKKYPPPPPKKDTSYLVPIKHCKNCKSEIEIHSPERPLVVTCPSCKKRYKLTK